MQPDPGRGAPPDTLIDLICYLELPDQPAIVPAGAGKGGQVAVMFCLGAEGEDGAVKDGAGFHSTPPSSITPALVVLVLSASTMRTIVRHSAETSCSNRDQILLALIGPWWAAPPGDLVQTRARSDPERLVLPVVSSASRNGSDGAAQVVQTCCLMTSQPWTSG